MKQKWINERGIFFPISGDAVLYDTPGNGVFQVATSPNPIDGRIGLRKISDKFEFDFKIYDLGSDDIIRQVKATWNSEHFVKLNKNLGVVFNGTKGTGKTLSAKLLCNELNIPVVIIQNDFDGLLEFMQSLCFECIVFIDEAEKTFRRNENDTILLRLIDGVYNKSRKLYLLTTNQLSLNDNLLGRPGRIRYTYEFGNLTPKAINEYINDNLLPQYESQRIKIIQLVDTLEISTIDILKAIVDEVNIHGEIPRKHHMNLPLSKYTIKILEFMHVKDRNRIQEIKEALNKYVGESEYDTLEKWLDAIRPDDERKEKTNESLLDEIYGYVYVSEVHPPQPVLEKGLTMYGYKVTMAPDTDGYFMMTSRYDKKEHLCVILNYDTPPSLYMGELTML